MFIERFFFSCFLFFFSPSFSMDTAVPFPFIFFTRETVPRRLPGSEKAFLIKTSSIAFLIGAATRLSDRTYAGAILKTGAGNVGAAWQRRLSRARNILLR